MRKTVNGLAKRSKRVRRRWICSAWWMSETMFAVVETREECCNRRIQTWV